MNGLTSRSTGSLVRIRSPRPVNVRVVMPKGNEMKFLTALACVAVLVFGHGPVLAKDNCPPMPKAENEGDPWYIPESAFTKEAANKALKELSNQVNAGVKGRDFLIDNELKMIKGYLYRAYLEEHKRAFGEEDSMLREEFCRFIRDEAYVSH